VSTVRYTEGGVTVTLSDDLAQWVDRVVTQAGGAVLAEMRREAEAVAAKARADWYGPNGVTRRTGMSGDIQVYTTVSPTEVRVGLGSTDSRTANNRFVAMYVHRPGRLSLTPKMVTRGEWWEWKKAGKPVGKGGSPHGVDWTIYEANDAASDGANLMSEFVRKPMTLRMRTLPDALREAILAKVS
jgi:hypothetical protein